MGFHRNTCHLVRRKNFENVFSFVMRSWREKRLPRSVEESSRFALFTNRLGRLILNSILFDCRNCCSYNFNTTMAVEGKLEFTKQMRKATREIHDISDALVNAKLGIGKVPLYYFIVQY